MCPGTCGSSDIRDKPPRAGQLTRGISAEGNPNGIGASDPPTPEMAEETDPAGLRVQVRGEGRQHHAGGAWASGSSPLRLRDRESAEREPRGALSPEGQELAARSGMQLQPRRTDEVSVDCPSTTARSSRGDLPPSQETTDCLRGAREES